MYKHRERVFRLIVGKLKAYFTRYTGIYFAPGDSFGAPMRSGCLYWSNVSKAASYLHPKGLGGQQHDAKRLVTLSTTEKMQVS
ncbi:hypothetical protein GCM10011571_34690 [Marinithermofilum abyssi]|uniref:Uncharacterized protein n=1 Tax=Marinithermofilum abyssi TaxID=1571185 RepID=A0A8J2VM45_9BACL|nr:hypothetical protein GCM10011571_34690 [Marinithermofilum abyssi]